MYNCAIFCNFYVGNTCHPVFTRGFPKDPEIGANILLIKTYVFYLALLTSFCRSDKQSL